MSARVLKWEVPVDDREHLVGSGPVVLVASQGAPGTVYVWTIEYGDDVTPTWRARAFGTGHSLPDDGDWSHVGSCQAGPFVWHVFRDEPF